MSGRVIVFFSWMWRWGWKRWDGAMGTLVALQRAGQEDTRPLSFAFSVQDGFRSTDLFCGGIEWARGGTLYPSQPPPASWLSVSVSLSSFHPTVSRFPFWESLVFSQLLMLMLTLPTPVPGVKLSEPGAGPTEETGKQQCCAT
ncbi:hypothetical protein MVEN_01873300 [Mycena venus]|uniref:Uncharacterized protein n=1 Tax=Mycena venus TaxID=2733690 RepID=A0A8H7CN39_9AGAR|nr:hypothetical protein MVEN_01873300 [Mycena venus]